MYREHNMENMNTAIGCKRLREFDIDSNTL